MVKSAGSQLAACLGSSLAKGRAFAERFGVARVHGDLERFKELVAEAAPLEVRRYLFPNLRAVNFVIVGLLGDGAAASSRLDPQAKGLGEYLRSRLVDLPVSLLEAT